MPPDPRRVVGAAVHTKASNCTNSANLHKYYGAASKTKLVPGTVVNVVTNVVNKRSVCWITADYALGSDFTKLVTLNVRSVLAGPVPEIVSTPLPAAPPPVTPAAVAGVEEETPDRQGENQTTVQSPPSPAPHQGAPEPSRTTLLCHERAWQEGVCLTPVGGPQLARPWFVRRRSGVGTISSGTPDFGMNPIDYFLEMFPASQLTAMVKLTNEQLFDKKLRGTTVGEMLKFFGVIILCTRFEFRARASLWSTNSKSKYVPAVGMGKTGLSRKRFDDLWRAMRWSKQPKERPLGMSPEDYRWARVEDFVHRFNDDRERLFSPSEFIFVDESMNCWYGQGGYWINHGLPQYIAIDRKPENGCEIQNSACGRSGVMHMLKLVRTAERENAHSAENDAGLPHGTQITLDLVEPLNGSDRIVCADSYFASVCTCAELKARGLRFIG